MDAAVYCRISRDADGRGEGVERQEADARALADRLGLTVAHVYVDNDLGASTRSRAARPEYAAMLEAARGGKFGAVIAYSNSRLTRRPREWEDLIELAEKYGIRIMTCVSGSADFSTADGRAVARTIAAWDAAEAERTGERVKRAFDQRAEEGRPHGMRAYGWDRIDGQDVVNDAEADVIREASRRVITGESLRAIVADLNARGVPAPRVEKWTTISLRQIIVRDRNAGRRVHRGKVVGMGSWEPIVDADTLERVKAVVTDPSRRHLRMGQPRKWLLSGVAECGKCGATVRGNAGKTGATRYICPKCFGVRRSVELVDSVVESVMVERLALPDAPNLFGGDADALEEARGRLEGARARMATAADQFAEGTISAEQLARITARLRVDEAAALEAVRASEPVQVLGDFSADTVREVWAEASAEQRREVIRTLMRVTILPVGSGFRPGPESIAIEWRT
ncbi:recombinase family protein [Demequina capsici]|uniref:Recombinase family protein n=1 Tax=Demequina capsici TaxID=3075620 RepID=A0AA96FGG1_9MICO|nr:recombinase family protein [Demequina sp. PMTSA13]WNM28085.1 recombinase family protein [Demequina sp. PMTSA13]